MPAPEQAGVESGIPSENATMLERFLLPGYVKPLWPMGGGAAMTTIDNLASTGTSRPGQAPVDNSDETVLARLGLAFTNWAERWFPDAYVFVALAVAVVATAALLNGAAPVAVAKSFGEGFWSLITFTMQMAMVVISGYVVATSPPAAKLIDGLAGLPRSGRSAVGFVAAVSMLTSLLNWGMSLIFSGLLV